MSFISNYFNARKIQRAKVDAEKILNLITPFVNMASELASNALYQNVDYWSLDNITLINYLGYIAGVIDAADNAMGHSSANDWTATEIAFHNVIDSQLIWIYGAVAFIKMNKNGIERGGSTIGGLQRNPNFLAAMHLGGVDFLSTGTPGFFPVGLFELGLVTGGESVE